MCRRATCETCSKPTYAGCGMHVEAVLGDVPKTERCHCREAPQDAFRSPSPKKKALWPFT
jgi:hypothetical protein